MGCVFRLPPSVIRRVPKCGAPCNRLVRCAANSYLASVPCLVCSAASPQGLCLACIATVRRAADVVRGGLLIRPALVHDGAARTLVHRLKYEASPRAAAVLATMVVSRIPPDATSLVPVPRVVARRWRYGVDPGRELARALARRTGLPLAERLRPALWTARRAGPQGRRRGFPRFVSTGPVSPGAVLVDDVVTTGATLLAAAHACGAARAVTVTSAVTPIRP